MFGELLDGQVSLTPTIQRFVACLVHVLKSSSRGSGDYRLHEFFPRVSLLSDRTVEGTTLSISPHGSGSLFVVKTPKKRAPGDPSRESTTNLSLEQSSTSLGDRCPISCIAMG